MGRLSSLAWRQYVALPGLSLELLVFACRSPSGSFNCKKLQVPCHLYISNMVHEELVAHFLGIYLEIKAGS